ncbi:hypothetical protein BGZ58_008701 [Dissophora ornata]|nr:hypothetical protein BGZ58_008701 [Dissophora ornata]
MEEREESEVVGQAAEEHMATATGHMTPDHGEARHAAAEHGEGEHTAEDNDISEQEELLNSIAHTTHTISEWRIEGESYIGVFAPFLPTPRMLTAFKRTMLEGMITRRGFSNPGIDDAAVGEAVRMYINGDEDDASARLRSMPKKMRNLFETLLDQLPKKPGKSMSEDTFRANNVSQIIQGVFNVDYRISAHS